MEEMMAMMEQMMMKMEMMKEKMSKDKEPSAKVEIEGPPNMMQSLMKGMGK